MNTQNFNQYIGFPFETETLSEMQKAYSIFNKLGDLAGNFAIISGCVVTGTTVSSGTVYIDGELLEFRGGTLGTTVIVVQESTSQEFADAIAREVLFVRYLTFGAGANAIAWANFKRSLPTTLVQQALDLKEDKTTIATLLSRITALENKPSNIPIGLIALWGGLFANIPPGWVEHVPLRGRMPIGQNPDDADFATVGGFGGAKVKTLNISEMPEHYHEQGSEGLYNSYGGGSSIGQRNWGAATGFPAFSGQRTSSKGSSQQFSLMNPYRIVHFIRYIG